MTTCPNHSTSELVLRVRALARRKPTAAPRVLKTADLELDPLRRTASGEGSPLQLTTKEFAVLEALMRASPATLSTEDLLEQAWDENTDPFTKTVQVTIGRLRRKLGEPDVIETIPGVGYRITLTPPPRDACGPVPKRAEPDDLGAATNTEPRSIGRAESAIWHHTMLVVPATLGDRAGRRPAREIRRYMLHPVRAPMAGCTNWRICCCLRTPGDAN